MSAHSYVFTTLPDRGDCIADQESSPTSMRGPLHIPSQDPSRYAGIYLRWVASELRSLHSGLVTVRDTRLGFHRVAFGLRSYSPFAGLCSGWVVALPNGPRVDVQFELRCPMAVIEVGIASVVALSSAAVPNEAWRIALLVIAAAMGLGALLHYEFARARLKRILRIVATRVEQTEKEANERRELAAT